MTQKIKLFIISLFFFLGCNKAAITNNENQLYRIKISGKWGFINYNGDIKIPCIYKNETDFINGIALVDDGYESYYINTEQKKVQGLKELKYSSDVYKNYITDNIEPDYIPKGYMLSCDNSYIGEKMFTVSKKDNDELVGIMNKTGDIIVEPKFYDIGIFKNGMAPFKYGHNGIDGYIRKDGMIFDYSK
ncbi:WG repeat-containing protein [Treponema sp. C6A8]|uniref:WG repeat-containing protein n=1 Tax=Treponema sp. C6A8 TaxID=1410609 RepID=UPI000483AAFB|nr:WG repeat-containing protein [Treponema sp. C6A8]